MVKQDLMKVKFYSTNMLLKLINPENLPIPHQIRILAQDRKAWKRMEVDCWHHWESPTVPPPRRESINILRSLLRRYLKEKPAVTVTKC